MTEVKSIGISKTMFVVGIIAAILASSLISAVIVTQFPPTNGLKGDKGDTGATGTAGSAGPAGVSEIPFASRTQQQDGNVYTNSTEYVDIYGMSLNINALSSSNLLIIFSAEFSASTADPTGTIYIRALVDGSTASPGEVGAWYTFLGELKHEQNTLVFNKMVSSGSHVAKIQWSLVRPTQLSPFNAQLSIFSVASLQVFALPLEQ